MFSFFITSPLRLRKIWGRKIQRFSYYRLCKTISEANSHPLDTCRSLSQSQADTNEALDLPWSPERLTNTEYQLMFDKGEFHHALLPYNSTVSDTYGHSSGESSDRFYLRTPYRSQDRETACLSPLHVRWPDASWGSWKLSRRDDRFLGWELVRHATFCRFFRVKTFSQSRQESSLGGQGSWRDDIWYVVFLHVK